MRALNRFHLPLLGMGSIGAAGAITFVVAVFLTMGPSAAAKPPQRDAEAVMQYIQTGGRLPSWAGSPEIDAALAKEAEANGLPAARDAPSPSLPPAEARFAAALRLARMLCSGATAPSAVQPSWTIPPPTFEPQPALRVLASIDDPLPWLRALAPMAADYQRLKQALSAYHAIAQHDGWPMIPSGPTLRRGMSGRRVAVLRQRLDAEGDRGADPPSPSSGLFDDAMDKAVRSFQAHHGLRVDGAVGRETLAARNVDAQERYRQIAANMERWRWLPRELPSERIVIDAAAARLTLFEKDQPALQSRVIAGAPEHPTPALKATITSLLFNPPWDIPRSIAASEIAPLVGRDPDYLAREGIIRLGSGGRLRQLPGPKNALGRIKFEMQDPFDVYLHDTPNRELFNRGRRFFSHGCIRVENPQKLARRLLVQDPTWTPEAVSRAITSGVTRRAAVNAPIAVFVVYFTAAADLNGEIAFREDAYLLDPPLVDALFSAKRPPEQKAADDDE